MQGHARQWWRWAVRALLKDKIELKWRRRAFRKLQTIVAMARPNRKRAMLRMLTMVRITERSKQPIDNKAPPKHPPTHRFSQPNNTNLTSKKN